MIHINIITNYALKIISSAATWSFLENIKYNIEVKASVQPKISYLSAFPARWIIVATTALLTLGTSVVKSIFW